MTEFSILWPTGSAGDGTSPYSDAITRAMFESMWGHGVIYNFLNKLEVTCATGFSPVSVNTGGAVIKGLWYRNTETVALDLPAAAAGTYRGFSIVVRADWVGTAENVPPGTEPFHGDTNQNEGRLVVLYNTDGVADPPTPEQVDGSVWDLVLATGTIRTSDQAITLIDARTYNELSGDNVNKPRTRTFFVQASGDGYVDEYGYPLAKDVDTRITCDFMIPADYLSTMTVAPLIVDPALQTGNFIEQYWALWQTLPDTYPANFHEAVSSLLTTPTTGNMFGETYQLRAPLSMADAAPGDYVRLIFERHGDHTEDTVNWSEWLIGWQVSYLADN